MRRLEEAPSIAALRGQAEAYRQAYVTAHAAQTATGPDAAARSEAATARLEDFESLSTGDALRCPPRSPPPLPSPAVHTLARPGDLGPFAAVSAGICDLQSQAI